MHKRYCRISIPSRPRSTPRETRKASRLKGPTTVSSTRANSRSSIRSRTSGITSSAIPDPAAGGDRARIRPGSRPPVAFPERAAGRPRLHRRGVPSGDPGRLKTPDTPRPAATAPRGRGRQTPPAKLTRTPGALFDRERPAARPRPRSSARGVEGRARARLGAGLAHLAPYAPPTIQLGGETVNTLTFELDQSLGAGQSPDPNRGRFPT